MPVNAAAWSTLEYISAKKLNTDLYNFNPGNAFTPNGILFHSQKPTLVEWLNTTGLTQPAGTGGDFVVVEGGLSSNIWFTAWDSAAYYGPGMDQPYFGAEGAMKASTIGASGNNESVASGGGWYLLGGVLEIKSNGGSSPGAGTFGEALTLGFGSTPAYLASSQLLSTTRNNAAFALDLINPTTAQQIWSYGGYLTSASGTTGLAYQNSGNNDPTGESCKLFALWSAVSANGVTVPAGPAPLSTVSNISTLTSAQLTTGVSNVLNFLNNPPALRVSKTLTTTITNGLAVNTVTLGSGTAQGTQLDNYAGLSSNTYTVPVSGLYLVHGVVAYNSSALGSFQEQAGVLINGTTQLWGPSMQTAVTAGSVFPTITRLLDLNAGDTVVLNTRNNASSNPSLTASTGSPAVTTPSRLIMQWMGSLGVPSTLWNNPDPSFRWQAGTPGTDPKNSSSHPLVDQFNMHIVNDLGFLVNKPYLTAYQTSGHVLSGVPANNAATYICDTASGIVHGTNGDNYSGYNTTTGTYTCQRSGWYLVVSEAAIAVNGSTPYPIVAQVYSPGTGSPNQFTPYYWGQHVSTTDGNTTALPGATYVGLNYLRGPNPATGFLGDTIQPAAMVQPANSTNTWGTATSGTPSSGQYSQWGLVWVSQ